MLSRSFLIKKANDVAKKKAKQAALRDATKSSKEVTEKLTKDSLSKTQKGNLDNSIKDKKTQEMLKDEKSLEALQQIKLERVDKIKAPSGLKPKKDDLNIRHRQISQDRPSPLVKNKDYIKAENIKNPPTPPSKTPTPTKGRGR